MVALLESDSSGILVPRPSSLVHMLNPKEGEEPTERRRSLSERGNSPTRCSTDLNNLNIDTSEMISRINPSLGPGKAYYYSQLSVMLFEKAVEENGSFPEDLDRVHSWFMKDLSETQKLVCLHELLSLMSPSQHRFLFTSVSFDSLQCTEDETVWLDLAMSEAQRKMHSDNQPPVNDNIVVSKLEALDLTLGDSIFSGVQLAGKKNKLSFERSPSPILIHEEEEEEEDQSNRISRFSNFMKSKEGGESRSGNSVSSSSVSVSGGSQASNLVKGSIPSSSFTLSKNPLSSKAPPGFLSPNATEFRPSEPSCYAEVFQTDFAQWLRLLRLHKYYEVLRPLYESDRLALLKCNESTLEAAGVAAMGARRKFLRLFERIQTEGGNGII